jgi:hypothetical protein
MAKISRRTISDPIQGEKFIALADTIFCPVEDDMYLPFNTKIQGSILYSHTHHVIQLFELLRNCSYAKNSFIVLSHNSDSETPNLAIPECVKMWYSQNVSYKNEKLKSIPIGLENSRWFPEIGKLKKMESRLRKRKKSRNLLYINHNTLTNSEERKYIYDIYRNVKYATIENGKNGVSFEKYIDNIYNHDFVICPNGNGIDTHRLWETLYMRSIPVVSRSANIEFYCEKLPMLIDLENREPLDEGSLIAFRDSALQKAWNFDLLNFAYWRTQILGATF